MAPRLLPRRTLPLLGITAVTCLIALSSARAQCPEDVLLTASNAMTGDELGTSVSIDGLWLAVGAALRDGAFGADAGAAYIYAFNAGTLQWQERQTLVASDGAGGDRFGAAVAMSGEWLAVGAPNHDHNGVTDAGAVYLFQNVSGTWVEKLELLASDAAAGDQYGISLAMDNNNLVVGAWLDNTPAGNDAGSAYVYAFNPTFGWGNEQKLVASDGGFEDKFGISVAIDDSQLVVGAYHDDDPNIGFDTGAAYIFCKNGATWQSCGPKLIATDRAQNDEFGISVGIHQNVIAVGADSRDDAVKGVDVGAVYVFRHAGGSWFEEDELIPQTAAAFDRFGSSVAAGDNVVVGGSPNDDHPSRDMGSAFSFRHVGSVIGSCGWVEDHWLAEKNAGQDDLFGNAIAMSGNTALIGNRRDDANGVIDSGSAALFDVSEVSLDIEPSCVVAGQTVNFKICCGNPGEPALLALVSPVFVPVLVGVYGADCRWRISATVPPGLEGLNLTFKAFEVVECPDQAAASNAEIVSFKFTCP